MKTTETRSEIRPKADSPQIKKEEAKTKQNAKTKRRAGQSNGFFKSKSEEKAINQGCLKKRLSAQLNKKAYVILSFIENVDYKTCFLEREEGTRYVDTYSG